MVSLFLLRSVRWIAVGAAGWSGTLCTLFVRAEEEGRWAGSPGNVRKAPNSENQATQPPPSAQQISAIFRAGRGVHVHPRRFPLVGGRGRGRAGGGGGI